VLVLPDFDLNIDIDNQEFDPNKARCDDGVGTLAPLFFSEDIYDIARAKAICAKCSQKERCLRTALAEREPWGVWGGELISNGHIVANKRKRGRPPKFARPEPPMEEVPLPPGYMSISA
jgi:WhiB family transcriptional regulator, redox-sensing transcriptional regulator